MTPFTPHLDDLKQRVVADGGFSPYPGGPSRADATAWAIVTLAASNVGSDLLEPARTRLAQDQHADGLVCVGPDHPKASWPTSLAILAWQDSPAHSDPHARAIRYALGTSGKHWQNMLEGMIGHDTALQGWPWISDTHSWVEPTALATTALRIAGYREHPRVAEAVRMLLDRQLPHGGWNCGNTYVFGKELRPDPESTGAALHALSGLVSPEQVQGSLSYLRTEVRRSRTPIALGWGLLGLGSWEPLPKEAAVWIAESLTRQKLYGPYDTSSLALVLLPLWAPMGLIQMQRHARAAGGLPHSYVSTGSHLLDG
ncbi:MAG: prenyltransferase/squalene oxidase repeat-containing protein [Nitrospiraceae bacterium]